MNYKLQCMNDDVASAAHQRWTDCTIQLKSALLCFDITPDELARIQQYTGAHTVELSVYDKQKIKDRGSISRTNKTVFRTV